jgi:UDP-hydrolysing UDP-N-acetyl-D-glucosamine 2-epimerase
MSNNRRKLCVVTGSRAEYGLLHWLLKKIQDNQNLQLQLIVTGMHLSPHFGFTALQIEADGFVPDARVEMLLSSDSSVGVAKSIGLGIIGFAEVLDRLRPDILILLGDRFEIFAAAQSAMVARIPIAHIHGGELTEGLIDDAIRHSLTKMSHLHFVSTEVYRKRVIQLGENPKYVWNVGALGADGIRKMHLLDREELSVMVGFDFTLPYILVTYHPVTLEGDSIDRGAHALFLALKHFLGHKIVITGVNADLGNTSVGYEIKEFSRAYPDRVFNIVSMGQNQYLNAVKYADVVIGNSSSGLIEAPILKVPTVNIGDRQRGRVRASSVIDVAESELEIIRGINLALTADFRERCLVSVPLFGDGYSAEKIIEILSKFPIENILKKKFYDLA